MRAELFSKIIKNLNKHPSIIYRNMQLQMLMNITAKAFNVKSRQIIFSANPLEKYMQFTTELPLDSASLDSAYDTAYRFGKIIKRVTGFTKSEDLEELIVFLYHNIGIEIARKLPYEFEVKSCYFSRYYTCNECRVMSAMDSGIITGIFSDTASEGVLEFSERLTEGSTKCHASLKEGQKYE